VSTSTTSKVCGGLSRPTLEATMGGRAVMCALVVTTTVEGARLVVLSQQCLQVEERSSTLNDDGGVGDWMISICSYAPRSGLWSEFVMVGRCGSGPWWDCGGAAPRAHSDDRGLVGNL
jgi:hypothetical protein